MAEEAYFLQAFINIGLVPDGTTTHYTLHTTHTYYTLHSTHYALHSTHYTTTTDSPNIHPLHNRGKQLLLS